MYAVSSHHIKWNLTCEVLYWWLVVCPNRIYPKYNTCRRYMWLDGISPICRRNSGSPPRRSANLSDSSGHTLPDWSLLACLVRHQLESVSFKMCFQDSLKTYFTLVPDYIPKSIISQDHALSVASFFLNLEGSHCNCVNVLWYPPHLIYWIKEIFFSLDIKAYLLSAASARFQRLHTWYQTWVLWWVDQLVHDTAEVISNLGLFCGHYQHPGHLARRRGALLTAGGQSSTAAMVPTHPPTHPDVTILP